MLKIIKQKEESMKKEKNINIIKSIIVLMAIMLAFVSIINIVIISQVCHLVNCNMTNCNKCMMINNAIYFFENMCSTIKYIVINITIPLIYVLISKRILTKTDSLVILKVRLNE